jgi:hypothetical protein
VQGHAPHWREEAAIEGHGCDWREGAAIERKHGERERERAERREVESNDFRQKRAAVCLLIIESSD